ncbi:MAG: DUF3368 domain-containing protein [bacterium]|nr:DUF3368 domain-containing protein [bacterium]
MRSVVCDTAPLVSLQESELLEILPLAGEVCIPPAVEAELRSLDPLPEWLQITALDTPFAQEARAWAQAGILGPGEAEAIALVRQMAADWLLTDDASARLVAQREGIEVHGSLGLVLWAAADGHFDLLSAQAALDALSRSSLWISARVLEEARAVLPVLCSKAQGIAQE